MDLLPRWIVLQLTESCNLHCSHCYQWGKNGAYGSGDKRAMLDLDTVKGIVHECRESQPHYDLFGGEPLLYPDLAEVVDRIKRYGSTVDIVTNGTLLAEKKELFADVEIDRVWISIDGPQEINDRQRGSGVFHRVGHGIEALHRLLKKKGLSLPKLGISFIITSLNSAYIEDFFIHFPYTTALDFVYLELQKYLSYQKHQEYRSFLSGEFGEKKAPYAKGYVQSQEAFSTMDYLNVHQQIEKVALFCRQNKIACHTNPPKLIARDIEHFFSARWHSMEAYRDKKRCGFPLFFCEVSAQGATTFCHSFYDLSLGNVYKSPLLEIWRNEKAVKLRKHLKKQLLPICAACCNFYTDKNIFSSR